MDEGIDSASFDGDELLFIADVMLGSIPNGSALPKDTAKKIYERLNDLKAEHLDGIRVLENRIRVIQKLIMKIEKCKSRLEIS